MEVSRRRLWRALFWVVGALALVYVVRAVPIRDRCVDPVSGPPARVAVSRDAGGCTLHRAEGPARLDAEACARLTCEPGLDSTVRRANVGLLALLALVSLGTTGVWAWRWKPFVDLAGARVSWLRVWRVILEGHAAALLVPGIGGDAVRVGALVGSGASLGMLVVSVLLDRAMGLVTITSVAAALSVAFGGADGLAMGARLALVPLAAAVALWLLRRPWAARAPLLHSGAIGRVAAPIVSFVAAPGAPRAIRRNLVGSLATSALQTLVVRGLVFAFGETPAVEHWVYVGFVLSSIVLAIPTTPGGWGTGDAAFVLFLGRAGISPSTAVAVSLVLRLYRYLGGAIGAVLFFGAQRPAPPRAE